MQRAEPPKGQQRCRNGDRALLQPKQRPEAVRPTSRPECIHAFSRSSVREDTLRNISLSHPPLHLLTRGAIDSWELCRIESFRPRLSSTRPENRVARRSSGAFVFYFRALVETLRRPVSFPRG